MNENKINIFKCFIYSITGFERYRVLLRQSMGKAVAYLILLSLLLSVAVFVPVYIMMYDKFDSAAQYIAENMPDFRLSGGKLEVYGEMPIVIEDDDLPVVIDTTPGAEDTILSEYDNVLLITGDKMVVKSYVNRQEYPLSAFMGLDISKDTLVNSKPMITSYIKIMFVIIGFFVCVFFVIGKFISALVVSVIGMIANSSMKTNMSYRNIFKLSIFSMTLPLVIGSVFDVLSINIPFVAVLFYAVSGVYVCGAISRIKKELESTGGWDPYSGNTFGGTGFRNGGPNDSSRDYRYGSTPVRPGPNSGDNGGTDAGRPATPEGMPSRAPDSDAAHGPAGDPSDDGQHENNDNEDK
jgi:hypothetical protein